MDARAELALREAIRSVVSADLDELHAHLDRLGQLDRLAAEMEELRHRLQLVEQKTGLQVRGPRNAHTRRLAVIALREQGHSLRSIEVMLGVARRTVEKDLREARVSLPTDARGQDGKLIAGRGRNGRPPA